MTFSMARMMAVTGFVCVVLAAAFAMPFFVGWVVLTAISLMLMPQLIWIGALNTKGRQQAFFVGAILSGIPHFIISAYLLIVVGVSGDWDFSEPTDQAVWLNSVHLVGYMVGLFGGLSGMFAHWLLVPKKPTESTIESQIFEQTIDAMNDASDVMEDRRAVYPAVPK